MSYLSCPRCHLTICIRAPYLEIRNCPRCIARAGLPTPMHVSQSRTPTDPAAQPADAPPPPTRWSAADGPVRPLP
jgi:hypothetical protein